jgi:hypothetical protein
MTRTLDIVTLLPISGQFGIGLSCYPKSSTTEDGTMKGKRLINEQITYALRQAEDGTPVADVCRQLGVSEAGFYDRRFFVPNSRYSD